VLSRFRNHSTIAVATLIAVFREQGDDKPTDRGFVGQPVCGADGACGNR